MLNYVNRSYSKHILTLEDPIEFTFTDDKCLINQREIGIDVVDFGVGMKHAVREDPDIILVGELRDEETFMTAIHAAETGHLVFGTIHASSAPSTIGRILDLFPEEMHGAIRGAIAMNMKAIVAQKLLKSIKPGVGRVPTCELMTFNPTVTKLVLEGKDHNLPDAIRIGEEEGMQDFTKSLYDLIQNNLIDRPTAFQVATEQGRVENASQRHQRFTTLYHLMRAAIENSPGGSAGVQGSRRLMGMFHFPNRLMSRRVTRLLFVVTFVAIAIGVCPHEAWAQKPTAPTLSPIDRGPGGYLSLVKLGLIAAVFLVWVRLADWINRDAIKLLRRLEMDPAVWNPILVGSFLIGFLCAISVPMFLVGYPIFVVASLVPPLAYFLTRRSKIAESPSVARALAAGDGEEADIEALPQDDGVKVDFSPAGADNKPETG